MSFLNKLFGGGKSGTKAPSTGEAIQRLREVEEMLTKKSEYLTQKVDDELEIARKNGSKNKRVALKALKNKKRYEKQLLQIDGTLTTIEFQREALENANSNTEVLKIMDLSAKALKNAHQMDADQVHDLMDDIQEQQDISREITEALTFGANRDFDEDELNQELEELEQEEFNRKLVEVGPIPNIELPDVPKAVPTAPAKQRTPVEEDDDMKELAAWAS